MPGAGQPATQVVAVRGAVVTKAGAGAMVSCQAYGVEARQGRWAVHGMHDMHAEYYWWRVIGCRKTQQPVPVTQTVSLQDDGNMAVARSVFTFP